MWDHSAMKPVWRFVIVMIGSIVVSVAVYFGVVFLYGPYHSGTTVHGNLENTNMGAKETFACNDGNLKLIGDNNTDTITGHCRRLEVFGSTNHVSVDSADT